MERSHHIPRRQFMKLAAVGSLSLAACPYMLSASEARHASHPVDDKPKTNIKDALKHPRTKQSMPGRYPAQVVQSIHDKCVVDNQISEDAAYQMLEKALLKLTGEQELSKAWLQFVAPDEMIGLKVNPVAGKDLSTSLELTSAVIQQLEEAGVPRQNIMIWDRREFQLAEAGFTPERFPGIRIRGTEQKDEAGAFYDSEGKLYGESMIDKEWYYWADVEQAYDEETLPYMINEGKYSYFSKICTQELDKIINLPILKNAGATVTLALKNLAYGSITNTARLHQKLWGDTSAEVCAFPPLRDKTVLNIVDGIKGCYGGGPGAKPEYFCRYNSLLVGTDPVAVDRVGHEVVIKKRIEEGLQEEDYEHVKAFMTMAEDLKLGTATLADINWQTIRH